MKKLQFKIFYKYFLAFFSALFLISASISSVVHASCLDNNHFIKTNQFKPFNPKLFVTDENELKNHEKHKISFLLQINEEDLQRTYVQELYRAIQIADKKFNFKIADLCLDEKTIILSTNSDTDIKELTNFLQNYQFIRQSALENFWRNNTISDDEKLLDITNNNGTLSINFKEDQFKKQIPASIEIIRATLQNRFNGLGIEQSHFERVDDKTIKAEIATALPLAQIKTYITKSFTMSIYPVTASDDVQISNAHNLALPTYWNEDEHLNVNAATAMQDITIIDARASEYDNRPMLSAKMSKDTARAFADLTSHNVGKQIALVFGGGVITAPTIQSPILGGSFVITGALSTNEAKNLAALLKYGYLAAEPVIIEEKLSPL